VLFRSVWLAALSFAAVLAFLRVATDAEFAFASAVILPVFAVAWLASKKEAVIYSALAAIIWIAADIETQRSFSANWIPWANGVTRFAVYALIAYLTSSLREVLAREYDMARHDSLTGLLNRRSFFECGASETARARRYGHSLGIIFLDLDDFKQLNDKRGHEVGDQALKAVAFALSGTLRSTDAVARLGGDEFSVVLPEATFESATEAGHKIANALQSALKDFSPVSASIGIAWFPEASESFSDMVNLADGLMYEIKAEGKHGIRAKQFPATIHPHSQGEEE
jgi:diguanylate cyclase (GGDEF)-like protein